MRQGSAGLERLDAHEGLSCTLGPRLDLEGLKEGGGPESKFPPLFYENLESRTFFITIPNPVFLTQKNSLKVLFLQNLIAVRCRSALPFDSLNLRVFLKVTAKKK